jgi:hypothetical protein
VLFQNPSLSVSVWQTGNGRRLVEIRIRTLPWNMVKNFKKGFNGDYGVNS